MTSDDRILTVLHKIHSLLELLAEDKIAERDAKQRKLLRDIVGSSIPMQKSVQLMDGTRTQKDIHTDTSANRGHLSTLVGKLHTAGLIEGDTKTPKLRISVPSNFFENNV
jgi:hypothetical protein